MIQSLNVLHQVNIKLTQIKFPYLCARRLCQDPLEQHFGKIRQKIKLPTAHDFLKVYGKAAIASLITAPASGNCEVLPVDHLNATMSLFKNVSV